MKLPPLKPRQLEVLIRKAGFVREHDKGGHRYYVHPQTGRTTCVPQHRGDVHKGLAKKILFVDCRLTEEQIEKWL